MKTLKILLTVVLIILIASIAFFFLVYKPNLAKPTGTKTATEINPSNPAVIVNRATRPNVVAQNFYLWYLQNLIKNPGFTSSASFKNSIGDWLTPEFINNWNNLTQTTNIDPVLLAQDYQTFWLTNLKVSVVTAGSAKSTVLVSLEEEPEPHQTLVHLVLINNKWLIDSISLAPKRP